MVVNPELLAEPATLRMTLVKLFQANIWMVLLPTGPSVPSLIEPKVAPTDPYPYWVTVM
jgi:hypothetical protein